jgi:chemotaxis signal transduction protein
MSDTRNDTRRFVTFPLGEERFALDSSQVKELVMPGRVYSFPHTMRSLEGVLMRRGEAIPVCDLGAAFAHGAPRSLYVIAQCNYAGRAHTVAIPVSGDCELVQGERGDAPEEVTFVAGLLRTGDRTFPMLDLDQVVAHCIQPSIALATEAKR